MQGKASEAYGSAAGAAHEATRGPTTYEKVKDRLTPSTADRVKGSANEAYANAKVRACQAPDAAAGPRIPSADLPCQTMVCGLLGWADAVALRILTWTTPVLKQHLQPSTLGQTGWLEFTPAVSKQGSTSWLRNTTPPAGQGQRGIRQRSRSSPRSHQGAHSVRAGQGLHGPPQHCRQHQGRG